ncbi:hypothetical protein AB7W84_19505 [Providencia rettgeri]
MRNILILVSSLALVFMDLLFMHRIVLTIPLIVITISTLCGIYSHNFSNSNYKLKIVMLVAFIVAVVAYIYLYSLQSVKAIITTITYQLPLSILLISVFINVFLTIIIVFNLKLSNKIYSFEKFDNKVNPASGLPMKDGIDSAGNVFGQKQNNDNNF